MTPEWVKGTVTSVECFTGTGSGTGTGTGSDCSTLFPNEESQPDGLDPEVVYDIGPCDGYGNQIITYAKLRIVCDALAQIPRLQTYDLRNELQCCTPCGTGTGTGTGTSTGTGIGTETVPVPSCCDDTIPDDIYIIFTAVGGCTNAEDLVIHLVRVGVTTVWSYADSTGGAGGCTFITLASFNCDDGSLHVVFGADNGMLGTPVTYECEPLLAVYTLTPISVEDTTCCIETITVVVSETPP